VSERGRRAATGERAGERKQAAGQQRVGGGRGRRGRWNSEANKRRVADQILGRGEDSARKRLEERLRAAQGSPAFLRTYREYVRDHGMPRELSVLLLLLDLDDERETLKVLRALEESASGAPPDQRNLLRGRLRNLEMSASSDALAHAAVDLLGRL
jgi:hypothetical protein